MPKKAYIKTFGCQMNVHDSEKLAGILSEEGYEITEDRDDADLVVFNTCSIREKAEQKFLSDLGRLKNKQELKPGSRIAVAGCIAQQMGGKLRKKAPHVDYVLGPQNLHRLAEMVRNDSRGALATEENPDIATMELPRIRQEGVRAWVTIMYGCNNFCSYCIVPFTRGREVSRPSSSILDEIRELAAKGTLEVTLLGQNVNSYKSDMDFPELVRESCKIKGLERLRFVTNHPKDLSDDLIDVMASEGKVARSIHLPLQSGSSRILKAMNRKYTFEEYTEKVARLRDKLPDISITSDLIAGFPGEEDADHKATMSAIREIRFDGLFAFRYSSRPGTRAEKMDSHIPEKVMVVRLQEILDLQDEITLEKNQSLEGSVLSVLVEGANEAVDGELMGRSSTNKIVTFRGDTSLINSFVDVRVMRGRKHSLDGELAR